nr:copper resistance CopC family protein [Saccharomonospora sp. CUA-673]
MVGIALTALLVTAGPAAAHNVLISSNPGAGDALDQPPEQITLTFDQHVQEGADGANQIAVTGPDGGQWQRGDVEIDGAEVTTDLHPLGPEGEYVIGYRILSADGHSVSDEIRFTLNQPGPGGDEAPAQPGGEQSDEQAESDGGGVPVWVWIVAAVVLLGFGMAAALRAGGSSGSGSSSGSGKGPDTSSGSDGGRDS